MCSAHLSLRRGVGPARPRARRRALTSLLSRAASPAVWLAACGGGLAPLGAAVDGARSAHPLAALALPAVVSRLPAAPAGAVPLAEGGAAATWQRVPAVGEPAGAESLLDPQFCGSCHAGHYDAWQHSAHAHAADDPVFLAMNRRGQRETHGQMGSFCVNCHAPMAVQAGATQDGLNLAQLPTALKSVTCAFCHSAAAVAGSHNNPIVLARDGAMRGGIANPVPNPAHASVYSPLHDRSQRASSRLCGSCHDVKNGHGTDLESTFAEWQDSAFAKPQGGSTCGQCHMRQSPTPAPIAYGDGLPARRSHDHTFPGVDVVDDPNLTTPLGRANQAFLDSALQAALCVMPLGEQAFALRVVLDNAATGHNFPSGAASDRRVWTEVVASAAGETLYQSGVGDQVAELMRQPDPDLWMLRECLLDERDQPVSMFWQAARTSTTGLAALSTFDRHDPQFYATHRVQSFPRDARAAIKGRPERITLRVRLQPIGQDVLEELVASGDLDPAAVASQPIYSLASTQLTWTPAAMAQGAPSFVEHGLPVYCVSSPGFNPSAARLPAVAPGRCVP